RDRRLDRRGASGQSSRPAVRRGVAQLPGGRSRDGRRGRGRQPAGRLGRSDARRALPATVRMKTGFIAASIALTLIAWAPPAPSQAVLEALRDRGALAWQTSKLKAIRGVTIGPIENKLHPDRGYGSDRCARTMEEARRMGANWVSL